LLDAEAVAVSALAVILAVVVWPVLIE